MTAMKQNANEGKWANIQESLKKLDNNALISFIKDLYDKSPDIEMFISARFDESGNKKILEGYRRKILKAFMSKSETPELPKLESATTAIKDYKRATNDSVGTVDLIITYVKEAMEYSNEYCYCEEDLENSVDSTLQELVKIIKDDKSGKSLEMFKDDLVKLRKMADKSEDYMFEEFISCTLDDLDIKAGKAK